MDKANFIVLFNMTAALIIAGIVTYLFRSGKWPKKSLPKEKQAVPQPEKRDAR